MSETTIAEVDTPQTGTADETVESTTAEGESTTAKATPTGRSQLPQGVVSPITALNHLQSINLAPKDYKPQQMYGFVKNPGKVNPFPVKHYAGDGTEYAEPQVSEHGVTLTRPGVKIDEVVTWWKQRQVQLKEKAEAKAAKAKADQEKAAAKAAGQPVPSATASANEAAEQPGEFPGEDVAADEAE
jgi:hypothetical protein